ncbi:hypothetical protein A3B60_01050 [Candidatus Peregrinibacteria bacterium RIFCSPLOWO2_01_FULL_39_12]|nr:MAG: hypothetical protein A3I58_02805 [Candidatus Peregrinibacteria bacterium RIFCSPLOWO2_02_FULL_39_10]OGJ43053.1 MAG: hypothetical protein A3B60_01050 [Candidatus Peregrinibacteria bacterium RIFCSPLOWO2_01_FULL_39_12]
MYWCFATINNRLAEIFFKKGKTDSIKIFGHAYVNKSEYISKKEQKWIAEDTRKLKFSYRKGNYLPTSPSSAPPQ